ncbi:hypothetical protein KMP13_14815 [Epibacterium ulvae]|uniref:hypothetical protein n=1 Tax=Epibacterium ulvae TaxID=1156985 RepID=UPI001BFC7E0B|nr:hypothetical protein [Epibacterium ulvae]MBT8155120.1 hypothetical protein [Epibacterium ulvae]
MARDLQDAFGAQRIVHLSLENPEWFSTVLATLGAEDLAELPLTRVNEALPGWMIAFLRDVNATGPTPHERLAWLGQTTLSARPSLQSRRVLSFHQARKFCFPAIGVNQTLQVNIGVDNFRFGKLRKTAPVETKDVDSTTLADAFQNHQPTILERIGDVIGEPTRPYKLLVRVK